MCLCVVIMKTCCYSCINTVQLSTHYVSTMGWLKSEGGGVGEREGKGGGH